MLRSRRRAVPLSAEEQAIRFDQARESPRERQIRRWYEGNAEMLELISPGLLVILEQLEREHPRQVRKLRKRLRWTYKAAIRSGWLRSP